MTDLALVWNADAWCADLLLGGGRLATDDGMRTAILISLFSDAHAPAGAVLPEEGSDRRGWWGDAFQADGSRADGPNALGSTLWLLSRAKVIEDVLDQARQACLDALGWLVRDGIAAAISVEVEAQGDRLAISIVLDRPSGPGRQQYDFTWNASTGELA